MPRQIVGAHGVRVNPEPGLAGEPHPLAELLPVNLPRRFVRFAREFEHLALDLLHDRVEAADRLREDTHVVGEEVDDALREAVEERYRDDIERFGYRFGD